MFRRQPTPVAEHEARGETARIYHEIKQTMRASGVNLNFRTWAGLTQFFPVMWATMQPLAASLAFESAADDVRARAADLADTLPPLTVEADLGDSQRFQIQQALTLYHYLNPKLLVFTILVRRGLAGEASAANLGATPPEPQIPRGTPRGMAAMEMVEEDSGDRRVRRILRDIKKTMGLASVNSDYRTLALWPDYLEPAWASLKRVVRSNQYEQAVAQLADEGARAASRIPTPAVLRLLKARTKDAEAVLDVTRRFEQLLPPLILNIALLASDGMPAGELRRSPFPIAGAPGGERSAS